MNVVIPVLSPFFTWMVQVIYLSAPTENRCFQEECNCSLCVWENDPDIVEWPKSVVSCQIPVGERGGDYFWCVGQPFGLRKTSYLVNGSLLILKGRGKKKYYQ